MSGTDIIWNATIASRLADETGRRTRVAKSLSALQNQSGLYAEEHRRVIAMTDEIIAVIERWRDRIATGEPS